MLCMESIKDIIRNAQLGKYKGLHIYGPFQEDNLIDALNKVRKIRATHRCWIIKDENKNFYLFEVKRDRFYYSGFIKYYSELIKLLNHMDCQFSCEHPDRSAKLDYRDKSSTVVTIRISTDLAEALAETRMCHDCGGLGRFVKRIVEEYANNKGIERKEEKYDNFI